MADVAKISWWQWVPIYGWRIVAVVESADEVPQRLPRNGVGDRNGQSVSTMKAPAGTLAAVVRTASALLKVTMPVKETR